MSNETFDYIISRLLDNANDVFEDEKEEGRSEFYNGKKLAYYEILDTIKNELILADYNLSECGLDINLEKDYIGKW